MTDKKYTAEEIQRIKYMDYLLSTLHDKERSIAALENEIAEMRAVLDSGCVNTCDLTKILNRNSSYGDSRHANALLTLSDLEEETAQLRREQEIAIDALGKLSPYDRHLITLRYMDGYTYQQIAFQQAVSKDTVRRDITRILASM
jgi:RNA polymerase sigma factor (sigma-70 family)